MDKYTIIGFPNNYGLNETNVIIRFNSEKVNRIMDAWAYEVSRHSHRDQLSFNYVLWKHKYEIANMPVQYRKEKFILDKHSPSKKKPGS